MAGPAQRIRRDEDDPPVGGAAVDVAYRRHRAERLARLERSRASRRARLRFWLALAVLLVLCVALGLAVWNRVQSLFGI